MKFIAIALVGLLGAAQDVGKVESTFDKTANFAAFKTYSWSGGAPAYNAEAHRLVVAAFEKEMTGLGFTRLASGGDLTLSYYNVSATEVDLDKLDEMEKAGKTAPSMIRARMVVTIREASTRKQLWSAITRELVDPDPAKLGPTVERVAERLFATYPRPKK